MPGSAPYDSTYQLARYKRVKAQCFEYLGQQCVGCGSTENLEIDHIDPMLKTYSVSEIWTRSWSFIVAELDKCQLLCSSCHLEKTRRWASVGHGEGRSGKRNCPCAPCKARKAEYMKEYNSKRPRRDSNSRPRL